MDVSPETHVAIDFLRWLRPNGPWILTAISPDKKGVETHTFFKLESAISWIEPRNGKFNLYFSVNPTFEGVSRHPEKEQVSFVEFLHVDLDPRVPEGNWAPEKKLDYLREEQDRLERLLGVNLPPEIVPPSAVTFSGGGYQGFWRLKEPIPLDGTEKCAEKAKLYNLQLEQVFGADNTHNINRIMRLPGTMNLPDARKLAKGRLPTPARVISLTDATYELSKFKAAHVASVKEDQTLGGTPSQDFEPGPKIADVNALDEWQVNERCKIIIVQGKHPDENKPDTSRSSWLFDVCCYLVRQGVPDGTIYNVITNPSFGISASVLDKGHGSDRYARRQIERAREFVIHPILREFNEKFAVISNFGGKCRVIEEVYDPALKRPRLSKQSFEDFRNRWMHRLVDIGVDAKGRPMQKSAGKFWLEHSLRRQYETVIFAPGNDTFSAHYNMWKGFAVEPRPGNCELYLNHLHQNVCQNNKVYYDYLIGWMARGVQQPDSPGQVAVVLRGGRGVGKGVAANVYGSLFGRHYMHVANPGHLVGNFNHHLRDCVVLFADEAFFAGDKQHERILKMLITEDTIPIESKGVDVETAPNYIHLIMASNEGHVVPAGGDERRFFVLDIGRAHQQDTAYFKAIADQMNTGGREALLHHLLTYDIKNYEVRHVPQTPALFEQKQMTMGTEEDWWFDKLANGTVIEGDKEWRRVIRKSELLEDYLLRCNRFRITRRASEVGLGVFLKKVIPDLDQKIVRMQWAETGADGYSKAHDAAARCWVICSLEEARNRWADLYGVQEWGVLLEQEIASEKLPF